MIFVLKTLKATTMKFYRLTVINDRPYSEGVEYFLFTSVDQMMDFFESEDSWISERPFLWKLSKPAVLKI